MNLHTIEVLEGEIEVDEMDYYTEMQRAINDGVAWKFQGSYGRSMMEAIRSGYCMLGHTRSSDYYGNVIPSRDDVEEGTKGSYEYVIKMMGEDWADVMGSLK